MRWLQPLYTDDRPRDTPLVEEKPLACRPLSEAVRRRARRYPALADTHMQATPQKQAELCDQPVWVCETHSILLPPVPCYRKGCFTGSLLLHQLQGRKYFDAIKILLVFLLPPHPCKTGKHDTLPFMVMKDPDEGSSCSQTIVLTILTQDFPTAHCLKRENALYALSVYLQGRQSRQLLTESGHWIIKQGVHGNNKINMFAEGCLKWEWEGNFNWIFKKIFFFTFRYLGHTSTSMVHGTLPT